MLVGWVVGGDGGVVRLERVVGLVGVVGGGGVFGVAISTRNAGVRVASVARMV
jgi:hypothetical protein